MSSHINMFSVLVPGLSGLARSEELKTQGALRHLAMHGDSNLYLRSILYHVFDVAEKRRRFYAFLNSCYPGMEVEVAYDIDVDHFIEVYVSNKGNSIPIDLAATGVLQVIQIFAYACFFMPKVLVLDEPDAHLHADSQNKLFLALSELSKEGSTQIILATHSPHLMNLIENHDNCSLVWLDSGSRIENSSDKLTPLLTEIGALGFGKSLFEKTTKIILLTEDKDQFFIREYLESSGFKDNVAFLSYNGCENLAAARRLAVLLSDKIENVFIVIHRDRDFRTEGEVNFEKNRFNEWLEIENANSSIIYEIMTDYNDMEHYFCQSDHLSEVLSLSDEEASSIVIEAIKQKRHKLPIKIDRAREKIESQIYGSQRVKEKAICFGLPRNAPKRNKWLPQSGDENISFENCHGKVLMASVKNQLQLYGLSSETVNSKLYKRSKAIDRTDFFVFLKGLL
ncbi:hypothetical protein B9G99_05440 [Kushneria konosiri]|uniref:ATPase AAA-type core domain-containing protein n=1 Tax=Kushneria konosiri TaxID=698828 RepID=A0A2Z2H4Y1_9GAMM|nr:hypothetical protein B9G99_05440 [Kushneria konosiri]